MTDDNPLLDTGLPRFDEVRPDHALPAIEARLADYQRLIDGIGEGRLPATPDTLADEVRADDALAMAWSTVGHLHAVNNTPEWREAYSECLDRITAFYTARGHNRNLFACWKAVSERADFAEQPAAFRRMVDEELTDFRLSGVDLADEPRERFAAISLELSRLGNRFGNNVLDATEGYTEHFDRTEPLAGLPDSALDTLSARAEAAGRDGYLADISYPCSHAIVKTGSITK